MWLTAVVNNDKSPNSERNEILLPYNFGRPLVLIALGRGFFESDCIVAHSGDEVVVGLKAVQSEGSAGVVGISYQVSTGP